MKTRILLNSAIAILLASPCAAWADGFFDDVGDAGTNLYNNVTGTAGDAGTHVYNQVSPVLAHADQVSKPYEKAAAPVVAGGAVTYATGNPAAGAMAAQATGQIINNANSGNGNGQLQSLYQIRQRQQQQYGQPLGTSAPGRPTYSRPQQNWPPQNQGGWGNQNGNWGNQGGGWNNQGGGNWGNQGGGNWGNQGGGNWGNQGGGNWGNQGGGNWGNQGGGNWGNQGGGNWGNQGGGGWGNQGGRGRNNNNLGQAIGSLINAAINSGGDDN